MPMTTRSRILRELTESEGRRTLGGLATSLGLEPEDVHEQLLALVAAGQVCIDPGTKSSNGYGQAPLRYSLNPERHEHVPEPLTLAVARREPEPGPAWLGPHVRGWLRGRTPPGFGLPLWLYFVPTELEGCDILKGGKPLGPPPKRGRPSKKGAPRPLSPVDASPPGGMARPSRATPRETGRGSGDPAATRSNPRPQREPGPKRERTSNRGVAQHRGGTTRRDRALSHETVARVVDHLRLHGWSLPKEVAPHLGLAPTTVADAMRSAAKRGDLRRRNRKVGRRGRPPVEYDVPR